MTLLCANCRSVNTLVRGECIACGHEGITAGVPTEYTGPRCRWCAVPVEAGARFCGDVCRKEWPGRHQHQNGEQGERVKLREDEARALRACGMTLPQIAAAMGISLKTAQRYTSGRGTKEGA
jgi:hypothetical protein